MRSWGCLAQDAKEGEIDDSIIIQWWNKRSAKFKGLVNGLKNGHKVIANPNLCTYLNFQASPAKGENRCFNLQDAYNNDFGQGQVTGDAYANVMGASCCLWAVRPQKADRQAFPRILALAERMWSFERKDRFEAFLNRVGKHTPRLETMGIEIGPSGMD